MSSPTVLVVAETRGGAPSALTLELLGLARGLAPAVACVVFGPSPTGADALIAHGAERVFFSEAGDEEYDGEAWLPTVEALAREIAPQAILAGHTPAGADLAPRLAFRLETAVATGCVAVTREAGTFLWTRACFGGHARETLTIRSAPAVATVKAGVGEPQLIAARGEVIPYASKATARRSRVVARERAANAGRSLEDAKVIVAGGRGLGDPDGFRVLGELAEVLGGAVGSSRVPCDLGWVPHSLQIGLTGKTVTPELYFAIGISGAGHHMAGCGNSKTIVAINSDPEAAIFREARFGVVGDYRKVIPALIDALKQG